MSDPVRAIVLGGATGLLGQALVKALRKAGWDTMAQGRQDVDILDQKELARYLEEIKPEYVFNAAGYTKVDQAEDEPDEAFSLNKTLPTNLGRLAKKRGYRLIHYSTDFVFDGRKQTPYQPSDPTNPQSVYGRSKLAGEAALVEMALPGLCIIRTAWLFGPGKKNFVSTILDLANNRKRLGVVHDQFGSPTYTEDLARHSHTLAKLKVHGVYHVANCGQASWCELASEAVNLAGIACKVDPIPSSEYPQKAHRPPYSVLSAEKFSALSGTTPRPWAQALRDYVFQDYCSDSCPTCASRDD
jgi:dTDP-4-dehydrorhamnose reductase